MWGQMILSGEGLDEVIELSAIRFGEPPLGGHHFQVGGLRDTVVPRDHPLIIQHGFLALGDIFHDAEHRPHCLLLIAYRREDRHHFTSPLICVSFWLMSV